MEHRRTANPMVAIDADEMRRRRQLQGLNQAALAQAADVHRSYISRIEANAQAYVSPAVFARICDALGVQDRADLLAADPVGRAS